MNQGIVTQSPQPVAMPYGLLGRPTPAQMPAVDYALDVDAADYIRRVDAADGRALELPVRLALDAFIRGCKADGIWTAIKASCILAGARTLSGALVPLVGAAPTNFNFVSGDYNRKTGLVGDGSTKYLDSNRNNNSDPQNSNHMSAYATVSPTVSAAQNRAYLGAGVGAFAGTNFLTISTAGFLFTRSRSVTGTASSSTVSTGFVGLNRSTSSSYQTRQALNTTTVSTASDGNLSTNVFVFTRNNAVGDTISSWSDARLAFYSIGESLDLALLDARVTTLINTLAVVL